MTQATTSFGKPFKHFNIFKNASENNLKNQTTEAS